MERRDPAEGQRHEARKRDAQIDEADAASDVNEALVDGAGIPERQQAALNLAAASAKRTQHRRAHHERGIAAEPFKFRAPQEKRARRAFKIDDEAGTGCRERRRRKEDRVFIGLEEPARPQGEGTEERQHKPRQREKRNILAHQRRALSALHGKHQRAADKGPPE